MNLRGRHELDVELCAHVEAIDSYYISIILYHPLCYFLRTWPYQLAQLSGQ